MPGRAKMSHADQKEEIHQHSGWLIPLGFLLVILVLSGLFLLWYLRPGPGLPAAPTDQSTPGRVDRAGRGLRHSRQLHQNPRRPAGGEQDEVTLVGPVADMRGYSDAEARLFAGNAPDSPVVHLRCAATPIGWTPPAGWRASICPISPIPTGTPGPFGLTRYGFRQDSGYGRDDLFAGENDGKLICCCASGRRRICPAPTAWRSTGPGQVGEPLLPLQAGPAGALARIVRRRECPGRAALKQKKRTEVQAGALAPGLGASAARGGRLRQIHFQDRHVEGIGDFAVFLVLEQHADEFAIDLHFDGIRPAWGARRW